MIQLLILLPQELAIGFEGFAFAQHFQISLQPVFQHIPQLFALGREVERLKTFFDICGVNRSANCVLRLTHS